MKVTAATAWIRDYAREANDSGIYPDSRIERALQTVLSRLRLDLKWGRQTNTFAVNAGNPVVDISSIITSGFIPARFLSASIQVFEPAYFRTDPGDSTLPGWSYAGQAYDGNQALTITGGNLGTTVTGTVFITGGSVSSISLVGGPYDLSNNPTYSVPGTNVGSQRGLPLDLTDYNDVRKYRFHLQRTEPLYISFKQPSSGAGICGLAPIPDKSYFLDIEWYPPMAQWTPGNAGTTDIPFDNDLILIVLPYIAGMVQLNVPEQNVVSSPMYKELLSAIQKLVSMGTMGTKTTAKLRAF